MANYGRRATNFNCLAFKRGMHRILIKILCLLVGISNTNKLHLEYFRYSMPLERHVQMMLNNTLGHGPLHKERFRNSFALNKR